MSTQESKPISQMLSKWRWFIMGTIGLLAIFLEIVERSSSHTLIWDYEFVIEVTLEGILIPLLGVMLLGILQKTIIREIQVANNLSHKEALSRLINTVPDWNKLLRVIVEFPRIVIPLSGSVLVIYNSRSNQYEKAEIWGFYNDQEPVSFFETYNPVCSVCQARLHTSRLFPCECQILQDSSEPLVQYCLPLTHAGTLLALLYLFVPTEARLTPDQEALLNGLGSDMALALDAARSKQAHHQLKANMDAERRQIARHLHDHVAQSLIYMRHKLDDLVEGNDLSTQSDIQPDLQRMREITEEAYIAVRSNLKEIEGKNPVNLDKMLSDYLQTLRKRVSFDIQLVENGQLRQVQMRTARHVLNIIGELIANAEKHAEAQRVEINLAWNYDGLTISVCDNGKGFDDLVLTQDGHLGMTIMRERAEELNGRFEIQSRPAAGTQAVLWLPVSFEL